MWVLKVSWTEHLAGIIESMTVISRGLVVEMVEYMTVRWEGHVARMVESMMSRQVTYL